MIRILDGMIFSDCGFPFSKLASIHLRLNESTKSSLKRPSGSFFILFLRDET
jgi:hypothetical protein